MKNLNCKRLIDLIRDENKGVIEYRKYNLPNLAKDEAKHVKFLKAKLARCNGK
jgi:hypothetical protein